MNNNDIGSIDRKIKQSANDNLNGLENTLEHIDEINTTKFAELQDTAQEMVGDCSKDDLKRVIKLLIKIERKTLEDE